MSIEWEGIRLTTDGHRLSIEGERERLDDEECLQLRCRVALALPAPVLSPEFRGRVDTGTRERLAAFAERTLAPATEESRRCGAGGDAD